MEILRGIKDLERPFDRTVVTIGNFDGVHRGHRQILETAKGIAKVRQSTLVVYTFKPHPQVALRPERKLPLLSTYSERLELLDRAGAEAVVEEPFSRDFSNTSAEQFVSDHLIRRLNAVAVVVGYDFSFGKGREGHLQALEELCRRGGISLTVVPPFRLEDEVVSSSSVRRLLLAGEVDRAAELLGYPFFYRGVVIRGEQRGRKLGFPTANLRLEDKLGLPYGVYATVAVSGGKEYPSVTNLGVRPTFQAARPAGTEEAPELEALVEAHLLDQDVDLYGRTLEVRFIKRLREERKFPGLNELKAQIARDAAEARALLSN